MKKILIISTNAIVDSYLSLSSIMPIRKEVNDVHFTIIFNRGAYVLQSNYDNNINYRFIDKSIWSMIKMFKFLITNKFDYAFSFFPGRFNSYLLRVARATRKGGYYSVKNIQRWDNKELVASIKINPLQKKLIRWYPELNFLYLIKNILSEIFKIIEVEKYRPIEVKKGSGKKERVIIHPFSQIKYKVLTTEQLKLLLSSLNNAGFKEIYILGTKNEINKLLRDNYFSRFRFLTNLSLEDLICELKKSFFIGVDSYPLHVADAYDFDFVGLFSSTNPYSVLVNSSKAMKFDCDDFAVLLEDKFLESVAVIAEFINNGKLNFDTQS